MAKFTNTAVGARGINIEGGETVWVEPGQTVDVDEKTVAHAHEDIKKGEAAAKKAASSDEEPSAA
jgi:hypothetical protein